MSNLTLDEFAAATYTDWRKQAEATLDGAPFEKKLVSKTYEGIDLQPIYNAEDVQSAPSLPGFEPFTRGTHAAPRSWEVIEDQPAEVEFSRAVLNSAPATGSVEIGVGQYHDAGANAVQEIAFALATGVEYFRALGVGAAPRMRFTFAVGSDFFMSIAKFRAARTVWCRVVEACGGTGDARKMRIHARTALWNKSSLDPHTNLLRGTTEASAAVFGGCDSLYVAPFDAEVREPDDFSKRIARNTQFILRDECRFDSVIDPAGGSHFVEKLTQQLAEAAWKAFQTIEKNGGMLAAIESGSIREQVKAVADQKATALAFRRDSLVGVNVYVNAKERSVAGRTPGRAAEPWEKMRVATESAGRPKVFLANMGGLGQHKARADFATGFFQAGGLEVLENRGFPTVEKAAQAAAESGAPVIVICSTDATYPDIVPSLTQAIKTAHPTKLVIVAGYPKEHIEAFQKAGVDDFIHIRSNCYETLRRVLGQLGVKL